MGKWLLVMAVTLALLFLSSAISFAANAPVVSEMQIIYDSEPVSGELRHEYTFIASSNPPLGELYYDLSFFDAEGTFIGYTNGIPDLSLGYVRCNGTAYLSGVAASYEITWDGLDQSSLTERSRQIAKISIVDMQWKCDDDPVGDEFRHEYTCKVTGPAQLGEVFYEVAFFNSEGAFIGFTNGFAKLSSGSARCTGTAYLVGHAERYAITWQ